MAKKNLQTLIEEAAARKAQIEADALESIKKLNRAKRYIDGDVIGRLRDKVQALADPKEALLAQLNKDIKLAEERKARADEKLAGYGPDAETAIEVAEGLREELAANEAEVAALKVAVLGEEPAKNKKSRKRPGPNAPGVVRMALRKALPRYGWELTEDRNFATHTTGKVLALGSTAWAMFHTNAPDSKPFKTVDAYMKGDIDRIVAASNIKPIKP